MRLLVAFAIWILAFSEASAGVIVNYIYVQSGIWSQEIDNWWIGPGIYAGDDEGIPVNTGVSAVNYPFFANTSRVAYDFQQHGEDATIDFGWNHSIAGVTNDEAYGYAFAEFTPDVDMRYEVSGAYSVNGAAASYQRTDIFRYPDPSLALSYKESRSTLNETLVVGSPLGGDFENTVEGNFTGELNAGQRYTIFNLWYLHAYSDSAPSQATGNVSLYLSTLNPTAVPEPSTVLLMAMGGFGCFVRSRRKRYPAKGSVQRSDVEV